MPRTLYVDRNGPGGRDRARSLEEAVQRLISDDYGTIVIHTRSAQRDDSGIVEYLRRTWPLYLESLQVRIEPSPIHSAASGDQLTYPLAVVASVEGERRFSTRRRTARRRRSEPNARSSGEIAASDTVR